MIWKGETTSQFFQRAVNEGIRDFAYLPTQMDDGTWAWWEHYWSKAYPNMRGGYIWEKTLDKPSLNEQQQRSAPLPRPKK